MYVIVYGTLKSGKSNNHVLDGATFIGDCLVRDHKLYNSGFPVACPSKGDTLVGEVWQIDTEKDTLRRLDGLEGHRGNHADSGSMYFRHTVTAYLENGNIEGDMYVGNPHTWRDFKGMKECPIDDKRGAYIWSGYTNW